MEHKTKGLVVCMAEDVPNDDAQRVEDIVFIGEPVSNGIDDRLRYENVLLYKGVSVSKYHSNAGVGYWGTYVN